MKQTKYLLSFQVETGNHYAGGYVPFSELVDSLDDAARFCGARDLEITELVIESERSVSPEEFNKAVVAKAVRDEENRKAAKIASLKKELDSLQSS